MTQASQMGVDWDWEKGVADGDEELRSLDPAPRAINRWLNRCALSPKWHTSAMSPDARMIPWYRSPCLSWSFLRNFRPTGATGFMCTMMLRQISYAIPTLKISQTGVVWYMRYKGTYRTPDDGVKVSSWTRFDLLVQMALHMVSGPTIEVLYWGPGRRRRVFRRDATPHETLLCRILNIHVGDVGGGSARCKN